jgi:hypothetical protein
VIVSATMDMQSKADLCTRRPPSSTDGRRGTSARASSRAVRHAAALRRVRLSTFELAATARTPSSPMVAFSEPWRRVQTSTFRGAGAHCLSNVRRAKRWQRKARVDTLRSPAFRGARALRLLSRKAGIRLKAMPWAAPPDRERQLRPGHVLQARE